MAFPNSHRAAIQKGRSSRHPRSRSRHSAPVPEHYFGYPTPTFKAEHNPILPSFGSSFEPEHNPIPPSFADSILSFKLEPTTTTTTIKAHDHETDNTDLVSNDETSAPHPHSHLSTAPTNIPHKRLALPSRLPALPALPSELIIIILQDLTSLLDLRSLLQVSPEIHDVYMKNKKVIVKSVLMNAVKERKRHLRGRERERWEREGLWRRMWTHTVTIYVVEKLMSFERAMGCAGEYGLERD